MGDSRIIFKKPSEDIETISSSVLEEREAPVDDGATSTIAVHNPYLTMSIQRQRNMLPIAKHKNQVLYAVERYRAVIIVGETGCGKSTQVPQFLMEAGWCDDKRIIGITQPRRVAAVTLAQRVTDEQLCRLGSKVGFVVRFGGVVSEDTVIQYMTDGILLREMSADPLLLKYSVIIIDEAHERSVNTDLLIALLKRLLRIRNDLRIIVSSATLDAAYFRNFFEMNDTEDERKNTAVILSVQGSVYPVEIFYAQEPVPSYFKAAFHSVLKIHKTEPSGDILVFLTGLDEVELFCKDLIEEAKRLKNCDKMWVVPMYGGLNQKEQMKAFDSTPFGTRKIVVATNIAETSVTIPGISFVVDSGFVKMKIMDPRNGIESLMVVPISQAAADQRAGRAGRIKSGKCLRLYTESEFKKLFTSTVPEIQKTNLAPVILQLKSLGIQNVVKFNFLSRPKVESMKNGLELLHALGAIDDEGNLTNPIGTQIGSSMMYRKEMPKWVFFTDVLQNSIRDVSEIDPEWIKEVAPNFYDYGTQNEISSGIRMEIDHDNIADLN